MQIKIYIYCSGKVAIITSNITGSVKISILTINIMGSVKISILKSTVLINSVPYNGHYYGIANRAGWVCRTIFALT